MEPTTTTAAESMGENPLSILPPDMWDMIVGMCGLRDQVSMWKTCKTMGDICDRYFKGKKGQILIDNVYINRRDIDEWFLTVDKEKQTKFSTKPAKERLIFYIKNPEYFSNERDGYIWVDNSKYTRVDNKWLIDLDFRSDGSNVLGMFLENIELKYGNGDNGLDIRVHSLGHISNSCADIFDDGFLFCKNDDIIEVYIKGNNGVFGKYFVRNILGGKVEGVSETQKSQIRELFNVKMKE